MALVEFKNVTRVYKTGDHELRALDGVDVKLEEGKFIVILGVSELFKFLVICCL